MNAPVVVYEFTAEGLRDQLAPLAQQDFSNPKGYKAGTQAIAMCRDSRVAVEKQRKDLKAGALEYGRKVDAVAKELTAVIEEIEEPLKAQKAVIDAELERKKREREEAEQAKVEAELRAAREEEERKAAEARAVEEARVAEERRAAEEAARVERERMAAERAELERQRAEMAAARAELEAAQRAEREKLDAQRRELERLRMAEEAR